MSPLICLVACRREPKPACDVGELRTFLANLVADAWTPTPPRATMKLARVDAFPSLSPEGMPITVYPCAGTLFECPHAQVMVEARGRLIGGGVDSIGVTAKALADDLAAVRQTDPKADSIELEIDERVSWRELAPLLAAAQGVGIRHATFELLAGKTHATPPPPSSIDDELAARAAVNEADLERDPAGTLERNLHAPPPDYVERVYKDCAQARQLVADIVSERVVTDDKAKAIASRLPDAVVACGCKIEIPALERLMWQLWSRDREAPTTSVTVELAASGTAFRGDPAATWAAIDTQLFAAARSGAIRIVE